MVLSFGVFEFTGGKIKNILFFFSAQKKKNDQKHTKETHKIYMLRVD
jgi:hypothetical protein